MTPNTDTKSAASLNGRATKAASPEATSLITGATSLEGLFLAAAQAVALDNPREGAALALKGMMYADLKVGLQQLISIAVAAQADDAMQRTARREAELETATAQATAAEERAAREEAREEALHQHRLKQAELETERSQLRTEKVRTTGSEY